MARAASSGGPSSRPRPRPGSPWLPAGSPVGPLGRRRRPRRPDHRRGDLLRAEVGRAAGRGAASRWLAFPISRAGAGGLRPRPAEGGGDPGPLLRPRIRSSDDPLLRAERGRPAGARRSGPGRAGVRRAEASAAARLPALPARGRPLDPPPGRLTWSLSLGRSRRGARRLGRSSTPRHAMALEAASPAGAAPVGRLEGVEPRLLVVVQHALEPLLKSLVRRLDLLAVLLEGQGRRPDRRRVRVLRVHGCPKALVQLPAFLHQRFHFRLLLLVQRLPG